MNDLALPLTGGDNRPIRDALGRVVSIQAHAAAFAHAMNMHEVLIDGLRGTLEHLKVLRATMRPGMTSEANAQHAVDVVTKLIINAEQMKMPPAPTEAPIQAIDDVVDLTLAAGGSLDRLGATLKERFRIYSR